MNISEAQKYIQNESKDKKTKKSEKLEKQTEVNIHEQGNLKPGVGQKTVHTGTKNQGLGLSHLTFQGVPFTSLST